MKFSSSTSQWFLLILPLAARVVPDILSWKASTATSWMKNEPVNSWFELLGGCKIPWTLSMLADLHSLETDCEQYYNT